MKDCQVCVVWTLPDTSTRASLALVEPESHLSLRLNTDGEVNHGFLVAATCLGQERAPDIPELDAGGHSAAGRITPTTSNTSLKYNPHPYLYASFH